MPWPVMMMMQAATLDIATNSPAFDLRIVVSAEQCRGEYDVIIVCARQDQQRYRLRDPRIEAFEPQPMRAMVGVVGDVSATVQGDQASLPGGAVSNRMMLKLKKPF